MNPEDIYDSIRKTTADIQNLSFGSKLERYDDTKKKREFTSQDSGIQDLRNDSPDTNDARKPHYNPTQYQDEVSKTKDSLLQKGKEHTKGSAFFHRKTCIGNKIIFCMFCCVPSRL